MVKTLHPQNYNDVYHVGDYFRQGVPVVMDLTSLPKAEAVRLIDFASGMVIGRGGAIDRVAPKVFLLTPPGVEAGEVRPDPAGVPT
ncbi:cell division protein SepF [Saccharopolyspora spinosa]|uniref:cell division protein SepF n=1 Tax=Saccharopolyspora spinosa TaxID=60894 RepID=UPI000C6F0469|nr:cell division protein SepF [Saccharopolyspora spinosa]